MNREEVKNMLEEYWSDNQYLKEKTKEVEKITANLSSVKETGRGDFV